MQIREVYTGQCFREMLTSKRSSATCRSASLASTVRTNSGSLWLKPDAVSWKPCVVLSSAYCRPATVQGGDCWQQHQQHRRVMPRAGAADLLGQQAHACC